MNSLVTLKWPGVEQFLLAHIARTALINLPSDPLPTLILLNKLAKAGFLSGGLANVQGGKWRATLISSLVSTLGDFVDAEIDLDNRRILGQVVRLIPYLPVDEFVPHLRSLIRFVARNAERIGKEALIDQWRTGGPWNDTHLAGVLLKSAEQLISHGTTESGGLLKEELLPLIAGILQLWSWSREVMESLASLVQSFQEDIA